MRRAGRINFGLIGVVIAVVLIGIFLFANHNSPEEAATSFMSALAKGDVDKLTELTYPRGKDAATIHKEYEFATQEAGKYYYFTWRVKGAREADANNATVDLMVRRNANQQTAYEESFDLPLIKKDGKWLVDTAGVNFGMYPSLPR